jgi:hypothetical protein
MGKKSYVYKEGIREKVWLCSSTWASIKSRKLRKTRAQQMATRDWKYAVTERLEGWWEA